MTEIAENVKKYLNAYFTHNSPAPPYLRDVKNQTDEICFEALKQNKEAGQFIRELTPGLVQKLTDYLEAQKN